MGSQNHGKAQPPSSPGCLTTEKLKKSKNLSPGAITFWETEAEACRQGGSSDQVQEEKRLGQLTSDRESVIYLTQKTNQVVPLLGKYRHSGGLGMEEGERGKT